MDSWQGYATSVDEQPVANAGVTGWGSAATPIEDEQNTIAYNPNSFIQNPTMAKLGNAFIGAVKDTAMTIPDSLANIGAMVYGDKPILTPSFGETTNNIMNLALPFMAIPQEVAAASQPEVLPKDIIAPTNGDIKLINKKLAMAGITPQQYADALATSTPQDFAGELGGEPLRMQTQVQAKITGPAMQAARDAMRQRLAEAPQRTQQIIENAFFPSSAVQPIIGGDAALATSPLAPIEPIQQLQQNLVDIQNKLPDLYKAAENSPVARHASLGIINTPAGQTAMKSMATNFANQGIQPSTMGVVVDPETGFYGLEPKVPAQTLSELSKSLGDQVVRNPNTGAIEDHASSVIEGMRKHITNYLSENSPQFATANMNAAANFQGNNAFEMGRKLAHSAAGENADALLQRADETFSPQELSYFKGGYAQGLSDMTQGTALGSGSPASRIAKGTVTKTASDIIGHSQAQAFADALMNEKNKIDLAQRALYGSNTAESLTAGVPEVPTSTHGLLSAAANKALDFVNAGKNARLAQLLYATSPEQKALLAQRLLGK